MKSKSIIGILIICALLSVIAAELAFGPKPQHHAPFRLHNTVRSFRSHYHAKNRVFNDTVVVKKTRPLPRCKNVRAIILENGTVTYCKLNSFQLSYIHPLDTVWLNVGTHTIDDTSANTMQVVLNPANF